MTFLPLEHRLGAFVQLGNVFRHLATGGAWPGHVLGITADEQAAFERAIAQAGVQNGWFTEANVRHMLGALGAMLDGGELHSWAGRRNEPSAAQRVGVIMAGNIPLVGFHDLLCTVVAGHVAVVKPSAQDTVLMRATVDLLLRLEPGLEPQLHWVDGKLGEVDAVIATGSNNTARYFEHYFGHLPHVIRKGRVSVAVLSGSESEEELQALGEDVFRYFGLGCRNVSKLFVPQDLDLDRFFGAVYSWRDIVNHNKYGNNYDYNKAVWLLERVPLIENGFLLLRESAALASPVAALHYERYGDTASVARHLELVKDSIQCVIGHGYLPYGSSQQPSLADYADGVDTMAFLAGLG
ncbi:MAG: acyl-CoA reductase [Flavobacteriales bacterium]|nr:MAG: acyl-CoA reductase [Flavobacteriales bacterium]